MKIVIKISKDIPIHVKLAKIKEKRSSASIEKKAKTKF